MRGVPQKGRGERINSPSQNRFRKAGFASPLLKEGAKAAQHHLAANYNKKWGTPVGVPLFVCIYLARRKESSCIREE